MVRMLVLYLLMEGALSGYDVKQVLSRSFVRFWFPVEDASIYSALKTLAGNGLATASKQGRAVKYRITKRGAAELAAMTDGAWESANNQVANAALAVSGDMPKPTLKDGLMRRLDALRQRRAELESLRRGALSALLARREEALLNAEIDWLETELETLS